MNSEQQYNVSYHTWNPEDVLKKLQEHCDKKMNAFFEEQDRKVAIAKKFAERHAKQVEKYLANQDKLIKFLIKTGKRK